MYGVTILQKSFSAIVCAVSLSAAFLLLHSPAAARGGVFSPDGQVIRTAENSDNTVSNNGSNEISQLREPTFLPRLGTIGARPDAETRQPPQPPVEKSDVAGDIGIPLVFNDAVERYIKYFSTTKKDLFKRWLKRKRFYEPLVKRILKEYGLPEDLIYLAMIESGFNLQAHSPMDADGPWQFIPDTGKKYGLTVNHWLDERRDIQKSTVAAARYLHRLFDQFDCWYLAAAAYNAGENRIGRLIKRHDTRDFWQLSAYNALPRETREYVPQLIAAAILSKNPEKYGFDNNDPVAPLAFVGQHVPGGVPLTMVAKAASAKLDAVKMLNPELRTDITPPGEEFVIKLPAGTNTRKFRTSLASTLKRAKRVIGTIDYTIRGQDDVLRIAQRYGITKDELILVNNNPLDLKEGELVYIPRFSSPKGEVVQAKTASFRRELPKGVNHRQGIMPAKATRPMGSAKKTSH